MIAAILPDDHARIRDGEHALRRPDLGADLGAARHLQDKLPGKSYAILEGARLGATWDLFRYGASARTRRPEGVAGDGGRHAEALEPGGPGGHAAYGALVET